jgi:hypothetical protein
MDRLAVLKSVLFQSAIDQAKCEPDREATLARRGEKIRWRERTDFDFA